MEVSGGAGGPWWGETDRQGHTDTPVPRRDVLSLVIPAAVSSACPLRLLMTLSTAS